MGCVEEIPEHLLAACCEDPLSLSLSSLNWFPDLEAGKWLKAQFKLEFSLLMLFWF